MTIQTMVKQYPRMVEIKKGVWRILSLAGFEPLHLRRF
jgi:hypothetical protein